MLSKEYRLRKNRDFEQVYFKGKVFQNKFFLIKILENNKQTNRFGFIVSNKISKKATERNKLKRRLREIIRLNLSNFKRSFDIIIIAKKNILNENFNTIKNNLLSLFKEVSIFKN